MSEQTVEETVGPAKPPPSVPAPEPVTVPNPSHVWLTSSPNPLRAVRYPDLCRLPGKKSEASRSHRISSGSPS